MNIDEITKIENEYVGPQGQPVLGEAYRALQDRWDKGGRDRETCLRLLFLSWYCCAEPTWLTGLPEEQGSPTEFRSMFEQLWATDSSDPEFLFVAGYMAKLFPWCCGEASRWERIGNDCLARFKEQGHTVKLELFEGRGAYGHYFAHVLRSGWIERFSA